MALVPSGGANRNDGAPAEVRPSGHGPGLRDQVKDTDPEA
jgi:hypothetical protein